jgi:hypothetical protein
MTNLHATTPAAANATRISQEGPNSPEDPEGLESGGLPGVTIRQYPLEDSRTSENSCAWIAETEIAGQRFEAKSRRGAPQELARALVAAGVPDQPVRIEHAGLRGHMAYPSLHRMAGVTYVEGRSTILHRARYREDERFAASEEGAAEPIILPDRGAPEGSEMRNKSAGGITDHPAHLQSFCPGCGKAFAPSRRWAAFCSAACKQKAYRARRCGPGSGAAPSAEMRNTQQPAGA